MLALRGVVAIVFGVLAILMPGLTLALLVGLFAAFALIGGIAAVIGATRARPHDGWGLEMLLGIVSIVAGVLAIIYPGVTALSLILLMGVNALITGVLELVSAIRLRKEITNEWLLGAAGVVSIVFGAIVLIFPGAGALALVWFVSFYATLQGILLLIVAMRARRWQREQGMAAQPAAAAR
jgi:uncharacterized membrane protein HdeD (DUF308 family)